MKTVSCIYKDIAQLNDFIKENDIDKNSSYYICIHTSRHSKKESVELAQELEHIFPNSKIIGTSAAAIIYNGDIYANECMIMFSEFEKSEFSVYTVKWDDKTPEELALNVLGGAVNDRTKALFVFISDHYSKTHFFLDEFNKHNSDVKIIGGLVSPISGSDEKGFVFTAKGIEETSVLAVSVDSDELSTYSSVILGHEAIGDVYTITKAEGAYIDEIDDCNSTEWFKTMLGVSEFVENNYNKDVTETDILLKFPMLLEGYSVASRFVQYEASSGRMFQYNSELKKGQKFKLAYLSPPTTANECCKICDEIIQTPVETMFTYSCVFRMLYLNHCAEWELTPFSQINISGAFMYGEIGNKKGANEYLNGANSIIAFSEDESKKITIDYSKFENIGNMKDDSIELLNYVLKKQNESIYNKNSLLVQQISRQEEIVNSKLFIDVDSQLENIAKFVTDKKIANYNKMCMISVEKGQMLLGHLGEEYFLDIMCNNIQIFKNYLKDYTNLHFYTSNQYSFFIVANADCAYDEFLKICEKLYADCSTLTFADSITIVNQFVVVLEQDNLLAKARLSLDIMEKMHSRFYIYKNMDDDEKNIKKTLEMVGIINEAIKNDYICPYFQPIHNNKTGQIEKYEALMRITDKNGKIYFPDDFLPVAKEYKLYLALSQKMIGKVFDLFKDRTESVSLNISAYDVNSKQVKDFIFSILEKNPRSVNERIIFEIVESDDFEDFRTLKDFIDDVRKFGIKIAIDDYGSGYSNMLELVELKPDFIKIDGNIISDIDKQDIKKVCVNTIVHMSQQMGCELIAEKIENKNEQNAIAGMSVDFTQGYYFSKPLQYNKIDNFLEDFSKNKIQENNDKQ